jgi:hypothetical protein
MIVEDERLEDNDDEMESDEEEENNMRPRMTTVWEGPTSEDFDQVGRDGYNFAGYMERYDAIRYLAKHSSLQDDLKQHLWSV